MEITRFSIIGDFGDCFTKSIKNNFLKTVVFRNKNIIQVCVTLKLPRFEAQNISVAILEFVISTMEKPDTLLGGQTERKFVQFEA